MLFARWRHHLRFCSGPAYAPFNAMATKISKWSRIQDSCRITPKILSLVAYAMPDITSKFQKDPSITFCVILYAHTQTNKNRQKHNLLGGGNNFDCFFSETRCISCVCCMRSGRCVVFSTSAWRHATAIKSAEFMSSNWNIALTSTVQVCAQWPHERRGMLGKGAIAQVVGKISCRKSFVKKCKIWG